LVSANVAIRIGAARSETSNSETCVPPAWPIASAWRPIPISRVPDAGCR
jgi:hypothetical protein